MRGAIAGLYFAWDLQFRHIELQMTPRKLLLSSLMMMTLFTRTSQKFGLS
ncbi:hypothetical protein LINPERHAP2_LOCUS36843 [Linum perenne]